jgi:LysM repeat protein
MKRLTLLAAGALGASVFFATGCGGRSTASAHPVENLVENPPASTSVSTVVPASGSPPRAVPILTAQTPTLPQVTVVAGDTLWGIGIRTSRTWQALASFNHIPNPNLIYVGQVVTIPDGSAVPAPVVVPAPALRYTPPVSHSAPVVTYTPPPKPAVRSAGAPGSFQACVAMRESGNGSGSSNIYGFLQGTWSSLGLSGSPGSASRGQQDAAFAMLYAKDGKAPWGPYDGCS